MSTREIGAQWEEAVAAHLRQAGLRPLTRNFACRCGEIDLVMRDDNGHEADCTVFVEVRFRRSATHGDGLASVGASKRAKLLRTAAVYLQAHPRRAALPCRFEVVACSGTPAQPAFEWIRSAFEAG
jgi:putative endonuclease